MKNINLLILFFLSLCLQAQMSTNKVAFGDLTARSIGPATMSGRVSTMDGVMSQPEILYIGAASGGVWKSINAGTSFDPIFDDYIQSIGDIAIDQQHPDTVWVGTGEPWVRNSVSVGDGIYVSTNAGRSWDYKGLPNSEHIAKVLVSPANSNTIYVAVQGRLWSDSEERGVYRSTDFGTTWEKVLYVNASTGAADITISQQNPNVLFAAMWEHRRSPDFFTSGGEGSGLYKSTDGGNTWTKLTNDIPEGELGRMAVEIAPQDDQIVYATIECEEDDQKGLYKSTDGGTSWEFMNGDFGMKVRPFYFSRLYIDPTDSDIVYKGGLNAIVSVDGGTRFRTIDGGVHSDIHDFWVNPTNNKHVLLGTDGGVYRSLDAGYSFEHFRNLPISQFYQISVDNAEPYNVYGGLQDNGSWYAPSRTKGGGIRNSDWSLSFYGDGFYSFRHPTDENVIYSESQGGNVARHNRLDGQSKVIAPMGEIDDKLRYNWNTPIHLSTHQPDRIYVGAQYLYRSEDRGDSWTRISDDLTTDDPERQRQQKSGGLSIDNSTAENNATIYAIEESNVDEKIIWVGSDDGLVHVTRDGGQSWTNVTANIPGLPAGLWVSSIKSSRSDAGTAYLTVDGHRSGDQTTYVYRTTDFGQSWTSIADGVEGFTHIILEDPVASNVLYLGTEYGLYISVDQGLTWKLFDNDLPKAPVHDLAIPAGHDDLVIGTHGRGIYIIDDLAPIRELSDEVVTSSLYFFEATPAIVRSVAMTQPFAGGGEFVGANPSSFGQITYYMKRRHTFGKMTLEVFDENGELITELPPGKNKGINIVSLPLRLKPPKAAPTKNRSALFGSVLTPALNEGKYTVRIKKGKQVYETAVELVNDPTGGYTADGRAKQREINTQLYNMTNQIGYIYYGLEDIHEGIDALLEQKKKVKDIDLAKLSKDALQLKESLVSLEGDFYVDEGEANIREDVSSLALSVSQYPGMPTAGQIKRTALLQERVDGVQAKYDALAAQVDKVNAAAESEGFPPLKLKSLAEYLAD